MPTTKYQANGEPFAPSIKEINFRIQLKEAKQTQLLKPVAAVDYDNMSTMTVF